MINTQKRKLIDLVCLISILFWGVLGSWLTVMFGISIWFILISLVGIFGAVMTIILNEPDYMEYVKSLDSLDADKEIKNDII